MVNRPGSAHQTPGAQNIRHASPAGITQIDKRQTPFHRIRLGFPGLTHTDGTARACKYRDIIGGDKGRTAKDRCEAGELAVGRRPFSHLRALTRGKQSEFIEGSRIDKRGHPLAGGEPAFRVLSRDAFSAAHRQGMLSPGSELVPSLWVVRHCH
ncbi:hypothetical protein HRUBRA_01060 [Pseudohaliea rubra DSM 19751]|uniref:Uncharacterized protein n=1 Tax=Pseudohaliea rubra DSM 19751 TaxID=1265313 RepID=A0A095X0F1_9GAMM|nr:hypothetical protein HRUBRA_01060 [Pseudohaliea rubra DSM 19751]